MEKYIDLHVHTTHSDGTFTPSEVMQLAKQKELSAIAITDHNRMSGNKEAAIIGEELDIEVVHRIELNADYYTSNGRDVKPHIVGLFVDSSSLQIDTYRNDLRNARIRRNKQIISILASFGFNVSYDELLANIKKKAPSPYSIARYMVSKKLWIVSREQEIFISIKVQQHMLKNLFANLVFCHVLILYIRLEVLPYWHILSCFVVLY